MYKILKNKEKLNLNTGLWRHLSGKGYLLCVGDRRIARACWLQPSCMFSERKWVESDPRRHWTFSQPCKHKPEGTHIQNEGKTDSLIPFPWPPIKEGQVKYKPVYLQPSADNRHLHKTELWRSQPWREDIIFVTTHASWMGFPALKSEC